MIAAKIAAALPNRWHRNATAADTGTHLGLLRDGILDFTHPRGYVGFDGANAHTAPFRIESLSFADGAPALRVRGPAAKPDAPEVARAEPLIGAETVAEAGTTA